MLATVPHSQLIYLSVNVNIQFDCLNVHWLHESVLTIISNYISFNKIFCLMVQQIYFKMYYKQKTDFTWERSRHKVIDEKCKITAFSELISH